jgi:hypothetical protein
MNKAIITIPALGVLLLTASAVLAPASACSPAGPGQCCKGAIFRENGLYCQVTTCLSQSGYSTGPQKHCWLTNKPLGPRVIPDTRLPLRGLNLSTVSGSSGSTHQ